MTFILAVDPLLEPSNAPTFFPFDPELTYKINIDNNRDAVDDIIFHFKFTTEEIRLDGSFTVYVGSGDGLAAPSNAPLLHSVQLSLQRLQRLMVQGLRA